VSTASLDAHRAAHTLLTASAHTPCHCHGKQTNVHADARPPSPHTPVATTTTITLVHPPQDGKKVASAEAAYKLLGLDLLLSADQHQHVSQRPGGFVQRFRRKAGAATCPFVLVLNFVLPWGSFLAYFAPRHGGASPLTGDDPVFDGLMARLLEDGEDDGNAFRNTRVKIIPRCQDGPWLVRSVTDDLCAAATALICTCSRIKLRVI
jgi:Protein ENHANCED DISEASE RESISTANCE 2, C-terminal